MLAIVAALVVNAMSLGAQPQTLAMRALTIPSVIGHRLDSAVTMLGFTNLRIVQVESVTAGGTRGVVIAQVPAGGTSIKSAKAVTLYWASPRKAVPAGALSTKYVGGVATPPNEATTAPPPQPAATDTTHKKTTVSIAGKLQAGIVVREYTFIPSFRNAPPSLVDSMLRQYHLRPGQITRDYSDDVKEGLVFRQHPEPTGQRIRVPWGTMVDLTYSIGPHRAPPSTKIPPLRGLALDRARVELKRYNLVLGHVDTSFRKGASGVIDEQRPLAGVSAHPGDAVDVTIAMPIRTVIVPDVSKLSRSAAQSKLESVGLLLGTVTLVSTPANDTLIIAQIPPPQTEADSGSQVDVIENRPPVIQHVVVPDLTGLSRDEAEARLRADTLLLGTVVQTGDSSDARVAAQNPAANSSALAFSPVSVTLKAQSRDSAAPVVIRIPSVLGLSERSAQQMLSDSGFSRIVISGDSTSAASSVATQQPDAGIFVVATTPIVLTLVAPQRVPNLIALTEQDARSEANRQRLGLSILRQRRALRLREAVVAQLPPVDSLRPADDTMKVDMEIPVVPPLPTAVVMLAGAAFLVGRVSKAKVPQKPEPPSPPPVHVHLQPVSRSDTTPTLHAPAKLIRHSVALRFAVKKQEPTLNRNEQTLIKSVRRDDA